MSNGDRDIRHGRARSGGREHGATRDPAGGERFFGANPPASPASAASPPPAGEGPASVTAAPPAGEGPVAAGEGGRPWGPPAWLGAALSGVPGCVGFLLGHSWWWIPVVLAVTLGIAAAMLRWLHSGSP